MKRDINDYNARLQELRKEKELFDKQAEIRTVRKSMRRWKPPTTTKLIMFFIFLNCTIVEIYSMVVMWYLADLSSLYALVTSVVTESISFAVYAAKAYNQTKQQELIRLERDRMSQEPEGVCDSVEDNGEA